MRYIRDAKKALNLLSGLPADARGMLSILVDLMVLHEDTGIPCTPSSYAAGHLGLTEKQWTRGILPVLLKAGKIKRAINNGVAVWVWADDTMICAEPIDDSRAIAYWEGHQPSAKVKGVADLREADAAAALVSQDPAWQIAKPKDLLPHPVEDWAAKTQEAITETAKAAAYAWKQDEPQQLAPPDLSAHADPDPVPMPSALDVLSRAGVPVYDHPKGDFFWSRVDHQETLREWLAAVPLDEIVARLARAHQAGKLPEHPVRLSTYSKFVFTA